MTASKIKFSRPWLYLKMQHFDASTKNSFKYLRIYIHPCGKCVCIFLNLFAEYKIFYFISFIHHLHTHIKLMVEINIYLNLFFLWKGRESQMKLKCVWIVVFLDMQKHEFVAWILIALKVILWLKLKKKRWNRLKLSLIH